MKIEILIEADEHLISTVCMEGRDRQPLTLDDARRIHRALDHLLSGSPDRNTVFNDYSFKVDGKMTYCLGPSKSAYHLTPEGKEGVKRQWEQMKACGLLSDEP